MTGRENARQACDLAGRVWVWFVRLAGAAESPMGWPGSVIILPKGLKPIGVFERPFDGYFAVIGAQVFGNGNFPKLGSGIVPTEAIWA